MSKFCSSLTVYLIAIKHHFKEHRGFMNIRALSKCLEGFGLAQLRKAPPRCLLGKLRYPQRHPKHFVLEVQDEHPSTLGCESMIVTQYLQKSRDGQR